MMQLIVFALGLLVGSLVNFGIYALAWFPRPISPYSPPAKGAPPRHWTHFLPLAGWWLRRGEGQWYGRGFWIRPLLLELALAAGLAALYGWEMNGRLYPAPALAVPLTTALLAQFLAHAILIVAMTIATFIDFDEQTIPDSVTIPGTVAGLLLAALWPSSLLPLGVAGPVVVNLHLTSPLPWAAWLNGPRGLLLGCAICILWCLALIPATCTLRRGMFKGVQFYFASALRGHDWWKLVLLAAVAALASALCGGQAALPAGKP